MTQITETGFDRTRLDELFADLQDKMITIFGADIDLEPDTVDGQTLGIFAEAYDNLTQLAEDVYHSFNPQTALGVALSRLVQLNGITRQAGIKTSVTLKLGGNEGTFVPLGSLVKNPITNEQFITLSNATIGVTGFVSVGAQATVFGPIAAPVNSITKIDNPVYGWQTVTNDVAGVPGRLEETDAQLRARRKLSTATPAQSLAEAVQGDIADLQNVVQSVVLENYTDVVDGNSTPAHGIHVIVQGGLDAEIAEIIWKRKSLGCNMAGTTSVTVLDSVGAGHVIKFSRPTLVNIFITINVEQKPGWPTTGATDIKNALVAWAVANQSIGEEVITSRLYDPINSVQGHSITSLFIGTSAGPVSSANIPILYNQLASFDISRITVNVT